MSPAAPVVGRQSQKDAFDFALLHPDANAIESINSEGVRHVEYRLGH